MSRYFFSLIRKKGQKTPKCEMSILTLFFLFMTVNTVYECCLWILSLTTVSEYCLWRLSPRTVSEDCLWRLSPRMVSEDCLWELSLKTVSEDCLRELSLKTVSQINIIIALILSVSCSKYKFSAQILSEKFFLRHPNKRTFLFKRFQSFRVGNIHFYRYLLHTFIS